MNIAQATASSTRHHHALPWLNQVRDQFICISITNNGPTRYLQDDIIPPGTMHLLTCARLARRGLELVTIAIIHQRVQVAGRLKVDAPASTTIATIWPSKWGKLATVQVHRAVASITRFHINFCMIE